MERGGTVEGFGVEEVDGEVDVRVVSAVRAVEDLVLLRWSVSFCQAVEGKERTALSVSSNLASIVLMIVESCLSTSSSSPSLPLPRGISNPTVSITVNPIFSPLSTTSTLSSCIPLVAPLPPNAAILSLASASPCPRAS